MPRKKRPHQLTERQQRRCLILLAQAWDNLNERYLGSVLSPPVFQLDDRLTRRGSWSRETRTITVSLSHMASSTWLEVEETLKHEMAHQYVCEAWNEGSAAPHGALFQRALKLLEADQSWNPGEGRTELPREAQKVLDRIDKLLALGNSSSAHEADAALLAASRLMLKYNLDSLERDPSPEFGFVWMGRPVGRIPVERKILASLVQQMCKDQCIWVRSYNPSRDRNVFVLEALGRRENLEMAHYTHDYLTRVLDDLWKQFRGRLLCTADRRSQRKSYRVGVLMGFEEKIRAAEERHQGEGMIWSGDPDLGQYREQRHPRISRLRGGRYRLDSAHQQGKRDGRKLTIHKGMARQKHGEYRRLLPG